MSAAASACDCLRCVLAVSDATQVHMHHGDCLEVLQTIRQRSVALIFADFPYGILSGQKAWDTRLPLATVWRLMLQAAREDCVIACTAAQPYASHLVMHDAAHFAYDLTWVKRPTGALNAKRMPMRAHEHVLIFKYGTPPYNAQMVERKKPRKIGAKNGSSSSFIEPNRHAVAPRVLTHKYPTSVLRYNQDNLGLHPTQKPLALLEWVIKTYTNPGDTALDPVSGSATTAIAAIRNGRNVVCIEKDGAYFAAGVQRVRQEIAATGANVDLVI